MLPLDEGGAATEIAGVCHCHALLPLSSEINRYVRLCPCIVGVVGARLLCPPKD